MAGKRRKRKSSKGGCPANHKYMVGRKHFRKKSTAKKYAKSHGGRVKKGC